jgi:hypothetical protein
MCRRLLFFLTICCSLMLSASTQQPPQTPPGLQGQHATPPVNGNGWGLSDEIAAIASIVAALQFGALVATVWVMILNGRRQLRAYVLPEQSGILDGTMTNPPQPARAGVPGVGMLIKNFGQTPAYQVLSWFQIAVIYPRDEETLVIPPLQQAFSNTLGPSATFNKLLWFNRPLTAPEITDIATGVRAIYLYGRIEYRDAFTKQRFTNFRLHYTGSFPPPSNAIFFFSEKGNDAN